MIIFAISIIFICSLLGNIEKYWEECGVNGSKRTTPYPCIKDVIGEYKDLKPK